MKVEKIPQRPLFYFNMTSASVVYLSLSLSLFFELFCNRLIVQRYSTEARASIYINNSFSIASSMAKTPTTKIYRYQWYDWSYLVWIFQCFVCICLLILFRSFHSSVQLIYSFMCDLSKKCWSKALIPQSSFPSVHFPKIKSVSRSLFLYLSLLCSHCVFSVSI